MRFIIIGLLTLLSNFAYSQVVIEGKIKSVDTEGHVFIIQGEFDQFELTISEQLWNKTHSVLKTGNLVQLEIDNYKIIDESQCSIVYSGKIIKVISVLKYVQVWKKN